MLFINYPFTCLWWTQSYFVWYLSASISPSLKITYIEILWECFQWFHSYISNFCDPEFFSLCHRESLWNWTRIMLFHQNWLPHFTSIFPGSWVTKKKKKNKSQIHTHLFLLGVSIYVQFIFPLKKIGFLFSYSFPTLFCSVSNVIDDRLMPICHNSTLFIFSENIPYLLFWVLQPEKNQI